MTVDWTDDNPHAHMAIAQYSQGVPLARKPNNVGNNSIVIPISTSTTLFSAVTVDQPSFQLVLFTMQNAAPAATPFARIRFQWTDAVSGLSIETDWVVVPFGNVSNVLSIVTGPARADQVTAIADSLDPAAPLNLSYSLTQHSQTYDVIRIHEVNNVTVAGYSRTGGNPQTGLIGSSSPVVGPLAAVQRLATTWGGAAVLSSDNVANANALRVRLLDPGIAGGGVALYGTVGNGILDSVVIPAGGSDVREVALPNGPVVIEMFNEGNAGNITPQVSLIRLDR